MKIDTHLQIDRGLCGEPTAVEDGAASVRLLTTSQMRADEEGLVHGGFVFGLVDYAAMLAVNHPHVVLGAAEVRLTAPVRVGDEVIAHARRVEQSGRRHVIEVSAKVGEVEVMRGKLTTFVLDRHVLAPST